MATFAGFVPAESPRLSAIVVLDEPTPIYGGLVSAPVFAQVAKYALRLFRIPPASQAQAVPVPAADDAAARADGEFDGATRPVPTTVPPAPAGATTTSTPTPKTP